MRRFSSFGLLAALSLSTLLTACGGTTPGGPVVLTQSLPVTPQSVAQQIQAKWPQIKVAASLALLAESPNPAQVLAANTAENVLYAQVSSCAAGSDTTCLASLKPAAEAFLASLNVGPKAQIEIQLVQDLLPPGLTT